MGLISLVYTSASRGNIETELPDILAVSRRNNQPRGVTGMLLYKDGHFIQALEGEEAIVLPLYDKIALDPRHQNVFRMYSKRIMERSFPDWTMGYRRMDEVAPEDVPGFTDFLRRPFDPAFLMENPSRALYLLEFFKTRSGF